MSATIKKSQILWERADNLQKRVSFVSRALFMLTNSANKQNHESPKLKKTIFRRECHKNTPKYGSHCDAIIQKKLLLKTVKRRMENEDSVNDHMISALSSIPFTPSQFPLLQAYDEISWFIDRSTKSREFSPLEWKKPKPPKPSHLHMARCRTMATTFAITSISLLSYRRPPRLPSLLLGWEMHSLCACTRFTTWPTDHQPHQLPAAAHQTTTAW